MADAVFKGRHFAPGLILVCVRWCCRYGISYRDLEEMMAECGVSVDHTTLYRWVQRYAPEIEKRTRWYLVCPPSLDRRMVEFPACFHDGGLGAPSGLCSEIGTLLPIAPCGRPLL